jgi:hypothetical protein
MQWLVDHQPKLHAHAFYFWTFSLKNCQDLPKGIAQLQKSFRKLRSRQYWKTHVEGGAFVIEIKGRPGDWHPHIHVIVYSTYMKWDKVFSDWRKCSGGRGCYVKQIPTAKAVSYITKYISKPDAPDIVCAEISSALRKIRLFAPIGSWHKQNSHYKKTPTPCVRCGGSSWMNYEFLTGNPHGSQFKEVELMRHQVPAIAPPDS